MSTNAKFFSGPALWTLVAGVAIGAGSMYSVFSGNSGSVAVAQNRPKFQTTSALTETGNLAALKQLDAGFSTLAEYASPAVVLIKSESKGTPGLQGMSNMPMGGEGSGVIFRPDGYILTNDHVVGGFDKVTVVLKDGREFPGKVTRAMESDIAVVKIEATNLPTLPFGDSSKVKPGQFAMAIGAPFGLENTVTIGHVSALGRQNAIPDPISGEQRFYPELIQTDASINMGNSGGPLINTDGEVIGINSSIVSPNGGGIGLGFAITSNQARMLAETLIEKGKVTRGYLGLVPVDLKEFQKKDLKINQGAFVESVASNGPAAMAGVKAEDIVVRVGSIPVTDQIDLRNSMLKYAPGATVDVEVIRGGEHKTFSVKLTEPQKQPVIRNTPQIGGNGQVPDKFKDFFKEFEKSGDGDLKDFNAIPRDRPQLGVQVRDVDENAQKQFNVPKNATGAVVYSVMPNSLAEKFGIKPGDVIESVNKQPIKNAQDLSNAIGKVSKGSSQEITFVRFGPNGSASRTSISVGF